MDEDTDMPNGYESDYPEPNSNYRTPYPSIPQNGFHAGTEGPSLGDDDVSSTPVASAPPITTVPTYTTLAEYFNLGNFGRKPQPTSRREDGSADAHDDQVEPEAEPEPEPQHRPWTNAFFNSYAGSGPSETSLPGFHALPETDRLVGNVGSNQQPRFGFATTTTDYPATSNERGRSRGRPRGPRGGSGRGIENARAGRPRGRGGERGRRRGYKWAIRGTAHEDLFKPTRLPRDPGSRPRGRKSGTAGAKHVDPGDEFKEFQASATTAFLEERYEDAMEHIFKALLANPEVYIAHAMMAQILEKRGHQQEALAAWTRGAFVKRDSATYMKVAERWLAAEVEVEYDDRMNLAIACYQQAIKLDKYNPEPRAKKLELHLELNDWKDARLLCKSIVQLEPTNLDNVRTYASLCDMTGNTYELDKAIKGYEAAFALYSEQDTLGHIDDQWDHLNVYLDLLNKVHKPKEGIHQLRRLARWFLGRKDDAFWDQYIDDREYDSTHERRAETWQFQQGRISRDNRLYGDGLPLEIRVKLGLFRLQMGGLHHSEALKHLEHLRRLSNEAESLSDMFFDAAESLRKYGMFAAAINFYEPIKSLPELVNSKFWSGLGQCHKVLGQVEDAITCYEATVEASKDNIDARLELVKLYESARDTVSVFDGLLKSAGLGRRDALKRENINIAKFAPKDKAGRPRYQSKKKQKQKPATQRTSNGGIGPDPNQVDLPSRLRLTAQDDTLDLEGLSHDESESNSDDSDLAENAGNRAQELADQKARVQAEYLKVKELLRSIEKNGDDDKALQWTQHASAMAKEFMSTKEFYPRRARDKYFTGLRTGSKIGGRDVINEMEATRKRLQECAVSGNEVAAMRAINGDKPGDFHDISFGEWHRILSNLALLYAKNVEQVQCYDVIQNILLRANVFVQDPDLMSTSLAVCICCALMLNDSKLLSETAQLYEAHNGSGIAAANQLVAAAGRLGYGDVHFYHRNTQRWAQSKVTEKDYLAMSPDMRGKLDWGKDASRLKQAAQQSGSSGNELDAGFLTTYAHITANRQGNSSLALSYLFRALALQPENLVVNLSIATTYVASAMQKGSENRQYGIAQGLAFLYRYYDLRVASGKACHLQEAEYNVARMWHMLGLTHLAVPAYEKVLRLSGHVQEEGKTDGQGAREVEDFAKEAALALQHLFTSSGNAEAARAITEEWLVL